LAIREAQICLGLEDDILAYTYVSTHIYISILASHVCSPEILNFGSYIQENTDKGHAEEKS